MLSGTGLLIRTVNRLLDVELGFDATRVATVQVVVVGQRYTTDTALFAYDRQMLDAARAVPGVEHVALTSQLPLGGNFDSYGIHRKDKPSPNPEDDPSAQRFGVSPDYFATMQIQLGRGEALY